MSDVYVAGVSMTHFGKHLDRSLKDLAGEALREVLADAGCEVGALEAVFFGNCVQGHMEGQDMVRGEIALRPYGIAGIPVVNVENACATASTAFHMAVNYVKAGAADIALAIGVEKMYSEDKERMFSAFDGAWDVNDVEHVKRQLLAMGEGVDVPPGTTSPRPYSVFMDVYAGFSRLHMREFGTTQRQLAAVAAKNHQHSTMNPKSQYQKAFTVDEVLAGAPITYPLTVPMCSPISDGAAAALHTIAAGLKRLNASAARNVRVLASVVQAGSNRGPTEFDKHASRLGALKAYAQAGLGPVAVASCTSATSTASGPSPACA
jgi:acetyl-CoA acyltransferase